MATLERIHLEIIYAVDQYGSLTAAADSLHLSQSALSHTVRKLEDQLNLKIWYREGRSLRPTQGGYDLLKTAKRLLPQLVEAEARLEQFSKGEQGTLRIGMECYPCYQWLQGLTPSYLKNWPKVDLDIKQAYRFGGIDALLSHDIDLLVTPDPLSKDSIYFEPVFEYEQVLVVGSEHLLKNEEYVIPRQLGDAVLFTYPVSPDRLDIFTNFLSLEKRTVRRQKVVENTDIMLQLVACGRGVAALPRWLVEEYADKYPIHPVRLGKNGVQKQICLGIRAQDRDVDYISAFLDAARAVSLVDGRLTIG
ncbi:MAG: LysR family transcriptional regulator [Lentisphaeria bacterium]|nr:LysR family transcriptional regulator [Lentisphaeria bacterium]